MKLTKQQKRLLELTKQLEQKVLTYNELCVELESLKALGEKATQVQVLILKDKLLKNKADIESITSELKSIKNEN